MNDRRSDDELLARTAEEPAAFGVFYERHEEVVLLFLLRRTGDAELAADLTAETFAAALASAHRFQPGPTPAAGWLVGIARNVLAMSRRRGRVEEAARRRLGMEPLMLDDQALRRVEQIADDEEIARRLDSLPTDQREAVVARVIAGRCYADIASDLRCSESVVRKRVSRGLAGLRRQMESGS
jgi:RNA polymerase sigma-70 factor (ECF subfamily)